VSHVILDGVGKPQEETMHKRSALAVLVAAVACLAFATAGTAATTGTFQASFVDIYSQCPIHPPTSVFCGDGTVIGLGQASSTAFLTGPLVPVPGTDCVALTAVRIITLAGGDSLTLDESGTKCPPSGAAARNAVGAIDAGSILTP
jgi:hypothetical protein